MNLFTDHCYLCGSDVNGILAHLASAHPGSLNEANPEPRGGGGATADRPRPVQRDTT